MCLPQEDDKQSSTRTVTDGYDFGYQDVDAGDDKQKGVCSALLTKATRSNEKSSSSKEVSSTKKVRVSTVVLLTGASLVWMVIVAMGLRHILPASSLASDTRRSTPYVHENMLDELGWLGTIESLRQDLVAMSADMKQYEKAQVAAKSEFIDITPLCDLIDHALDVVGVHGVFFELFNGLKWYIRKDKHCDSHGVGCGIHDIWWLQHYVGATTAEKLLRDGSLLLDGITGERIHDAAGFMREIHLKQQLLSNGKMSFHAQHAFIWHYLTATQPDLDAYPLELANEFCGDYTLNNVKVRSAHKKIGNECYHGFGHGIFMALATRQIDGWENFTARRQFRPNAAFVPTHETVCAGFRVCRTAPTETEAPLHFCHGGIRHSYRLLNSKWLRNGEELDALFDAQKANCEKIDGI